MSEKGTQNIIKGGNQMYLTEAIGTDYENWKPGDWIFLSSPPGSGKTSFCNQYARQKTHEGKKVIILSSRRVLVNQQKLLAIQNVVAQGNNYLREVDGITFATYQSVEQILQSGYDPLNAYDVIVCDECHYFLSDSVFNPNTLLSLEAILKNRKAILIFLSGTIEDFKNHLLSKYDCKWRKSNYGSRDYNGKNKILL